MKTADLPKTVGQDFTGPERVLKRLGVGCMVILLLFVGYFIIQRSFASSDFVAYEPEIGSIQGSVTVMADSSASGGKAIQFSVSPIAAPTVTVSASPVTISSGQTSRLTWSSTNATACTASGSWSGNKATSGSETTVALTATSTFSLNCTGAGGTGNANATVTVMGSTGAVLPSGPTGNWTLAFDDEFNGTSLDPTKWTPNWFGEGGKMNNVGTYAKNVSVSGGNLVLILSSSAEGALVHTDYSSGRYQLPVGSFAETRVYFPGSSTEQWYNWPAWWTSGPSWPAAGEHDIAEGLGGDPTANYHSPAGANNSPTIPGTWNNAFHTYGVYRKTSSADVYWDGKLIRSYATSDNGAPEELILNVGASGSRTPQLGNAGAVKVDYVRAWKAQ